MPSLKDIRKRISSVKSTQQITKAMKMVSAAKLRRAQESVLQARPYADKMRDVIGDLSIRVEMDRHPLLMRRDVKKREIFVITSDRGLCGGFNQNLIRETTHLIEKKEEGLEAVQLSIVGRKGLEFFKRRKLPSGKSISIFWGISITASRPHWGRILCPPMSRGNLTNSCWFIRIFARRFLRR